MFIMSNVMLLAKLTAFLSYGMFLASLDFSLPFEFLQDLKCFQVDLKLRIGGNFHEPLGLRSLGLRLDVN